MSHRPDRSTRIPADACSLALSVSDSGFPTEVCLAVLAQEMQVDRVKDDPALRRVLSDVEDVLSGEVAATRE